MGRKMALRVLLGANVFSPCSDGSSILTLRRQRGHKKGYVGNTSSSLAGCCHTFSGDGRCVTLLKVLMTNCCVYDCKYCVNRCSNDARRAVFTPEELAELTIQFQPLLRRKLNINAQTVRQQAQPGHQLWRCAGDHAGF